MASASRIARAAGAAALSTLAALTMHVLAGGATPAAAGILVPLAISFAVGVQLAGRPLGRIRLAVLLGASQLAFHTAFSLGSSAAPAAHLHHGDVALAPLETVGHAASMPLAHVAAATVTYVAIRRADTLLAALRRLGDLVARALLARLDLARPVAIRPAATRPPVAVGLAPRGLLVFGSRVTRGPPGIA